jgi:hypothetical protein
MGGGRAPSVPDACDAGGVGGQRRRRFLVFSSRFWLTGCGRVSAACDRAGGSPSRRVLRWVARRTPTGANFYGPGGDGGGCAGVGFGRGACGNNSVEATEHVRMWWVMVGRRQNLTVVFSRARRVLGAGIGRISSSFSLFLFETRRISYHLESHV